MTTKQRINKNKIDLVISNYELDLFTEVILKIKDKPLKDYIMKKINIESKNQYKEVFK